MRLKDHLENPILAFCILRGDRGTENRLSQRRYLFPSCSLLTFISYLITHHFFQSHKGCCHVLPPPVLLQCVVSGQHSTTAWPRFWRVTRRWWQANVNHAQCFPMKAWLPHRGKQAQLGEACLPVYQEESKKWFSLFLFHPAVFQLRSQEEKLFCLCLKRVSRLQE